MQDFIRGQRAKLSQLAPATTRWTLEVRVQSALPVFDFVCFGIDSNGQLSDDRFMVFFNQKSAPDNAIQLSELADKSAVFAFDLDKLPASIARLVFHDFGGRRGHDARIGRERIDIKIERPTVDEL